MNVLPEISRGALSLTNIIATCIAIVLAVFVYGIAMLLIGGVAKDDINVRRPDGVGELELFLVQL